MNTTVQAALRGLPDVTSFWSVEAAGAVTTLRFHDGGLSSGTDLRRTATLWQFFEAVLARPPTVLRISFPSNGLSHGALIRLWQHFRELACDQSVHPMRADRARAELVHEDVVLARYMNYVRDRRLFVVGDIRGQIDINLLGLLLVCDYRIAGPDTVIVNEANPLGTGFGTAAPRLLASIAGPTRTLNLLLSGEPLPARRALRLGIFHRLTSADAYEQDVTAITSQLADKGSARLRALKNVAAAATPPPECHVEFAGAGFDRFPPGPPKCEICEYDLTGNVSGRCPECGHATPAVDQSAWPS
jgi:enoyl-CoA hydratase/carnithine racemase